MGLNLLALGAIAIHAKFNPPTEEPARSAVTISSRNNGKKISKAYASFDKNAQALN